MSNNVNTNEQVGSSVWVRLLYMILFAIVFRISEMVMLLVAVVNLVYKLVQNEPHETLLRFGGSLAVYLQQIAKFLTYNTEYRPFPFNEWPSSSIEISDK